MSNGSYELHVSQFYTERDQRRIMRTKIYTKHTERDQRHIMCTKINTKHFADIKIDAVNFNVIYNKSNETRVNNVKESRTQ